MILLKPAISLMGVDKITREPVVNVVSPDGPVGSTGEPEIGCSLVFPHTGAMREFARELLFGAKEIEAECFVPDADAPASLPGEGSAPADREQRVPEASEVIDLIGLLEASACESEERFRGAEDNTPTHRKKLIDMMGRLNGRLPQTTRAELDPSQGLHFSMGSPTPVHLEKDRLPFLITDIFIRQLNQGGQSSYQIETRSCREPEPIP